MQMVNWPVADDRNWVDLGEGGMYAMLVVLPDDEEDDPRCYIDVSVFLTKPDSCVSEHYDLWMPYDPEAVRARAEAEEVLRKSENQDAYRWAVTAFSPEALSDSVLAAIHLGSTHEMLNRPGFGMLQVRYEHLTTQGKSLYTTLQAAFGREPKILTFIDT